MPDCQDCKYFTVDARYKALSDKLANATCAVHSYKSCVCGARTNYRVAVARSSLKLCGPDGKNFVQK